MVPSSCPQPSLDLLPPRGLDPDHAAVDESGRRGLDPDLDPGIDTETETDPGIGIGAEIDPGTETVTVDVVVVEVDPGIEVEVVPGIVFAIGSVTWLKSVRSTQA